jgi:UDP:flavonoid glycosyltransferase YjiC (YdhE family)
MPSGRPLVLVGLSSTVMRQEGLLQRIAEALGQLQVEGLITTGPAVDPALIAAPPNVTVTRWVRHADVLPGCSLIITHGGHGTVMKALAAGVPLLVVPLGRDQPQRRRYDSAAWPRTASWHTGPGTPGPGAACHALPSEPRSG